METNSGIEKWLADHAARINERRLRRDTDRRC